MVDCVREITGLRYNATMYYIGDGYYYFANSSDAPSVYLRCIFRSTCQGRALMPLLPADRQIGNFIQTVPHSHDPDLAYIEVLLLRKNILKRCREEAAAYRVIFDEECARVPFEISGQLGYQSMVSAMKRARLELRDSVPTTLTNYGELLGRPDYRRFSHSISGEPFFQTVVTAADGSVSVVFASAKFVSVIGNATEIHMDGTFKVVPRVPPCLQLLTIMSIHYDHAFPVFNILMERKTRAAYISVLLHIKNVCPSLNPTTLIMDFETAIQSAAREVFPDSQIVGCWFHSAKSFNRHARKIGLVPMMRDFPSIKRIVKMAMALPLLPADRLEEGFDAICQFAEREQVTNFVQRFLDYLLNTWIRGVGARALSVFGQRRRTNNDQESYHRTLLSKIGQAHPEIWNFTEGLRKQENACSQKYESLQRGEMAARNRPSNYILSNLKIMRATEHIINGRYTVTEFLHVASHAFDNIHNNIAIDVDDIEEDEVGSIEPNAPQIEDPLIPQPGIVQQVNRIPIEVVGARGGRRGRGNFRRAGRGIARAAGRGGVREAGRVGERGARRAGGRGARRAARMRQPLEDPNPVEEDNLVAERERRAAMLQSIVIEGEDVSANGNMELACLTCVNNRKTFACVPCYHVDMCGSCVLIHRLGIRDNQNRLVADIACPRCRSVVSSYARIFF